MTTTFLRLAPEFGGTCFGPFPPGSVAVGSDPGQCHVVLAAALGIHPVHAWLTPGTPGTWVVQPASMGAALFVFSQGRPTPATSAVQLNHGDAFALGRPDGPRFSVEGAVQQGYASQPGQPGQAGHAASGWAPGGRRLPGAGDMAREVQRQASTSLMTKGPLAPLIHTVFRARSGTFFQPRYIIGALLALGAAGFTACSGLVAWLMHQ